METPPRAWGRPSVDSSDQTHAGNTPTCVGKTRSDTPASCARRKHPHVRGEDCPPAALVRRDLETPPRAWGRRQLLRGVVGQGGNTPTCVGKTFAPAPHSAALEKHPHVRGEDTAPLAMAAPVAETPPRAWGRLDHDGVAAIGFGNTPTCVGKTALYLAHFSQKPKHPHVRGEDGP